MQSEWVLVLYIVNVKQCSLQILLIENRLCECYCKDDSSAGHWHLNVPMWFPTSISASHTFCFAVHHADWWNHEAWRNDGKGKVLQFTNRPWHHGFSKAYSVARNDPWVVERDRSSWRKTLVTAVFAHRCSPLRRLVPVWSGCGPVHSMRRLQQPMMAEAVADGHMDLYWRRALRGRKREVGEGGDRTCDDPRNSLSHKGELCTSHNSQHCYRDGHGHKLMTSQHRSLLLGCRTDPPAQSRNR